MTAETRTRLGPYVHARFGDGWWDRRAMVVMVPVHCRRCKRRVEAGATVLVVNGHDYLCRDCRLHHIRGTAGCPLCVRLRMDGPKCRHCGGTGYGEVDA